MHIGNFHKDIVKSEDKILWKCMSGLIAAGRGDGSEVGGGRYHVKSVELSSRVQRSLLLLRSTYVTLQQGNTRRAVPRKRY